MAGQRLRRSSSGFYHVSGDSRFLGNVAQETLSFVCVVLFVERSWRFKYLF
jgi:hypothetical protein